MAKSPQRTTEIPDLRLSGFAPAIASLLALGMPASRLAEVFDTNASYIHVLAHRGRLARSFSPTVSQELQASAGIRSLTDDQKLEEAKKSLKIRTEDDWVELDRRKVGKLSWLESRMDEIVRTGRNSYEYLKAAKALQSLKQHIGYPSESNRLKFAAKLHQHLAWFYTHSGYTSSSIREATRSIRLYEIVYHSTEDKDCLRELGGSCLIASNSRLHQGRFDTSIDMLRLSQQATEAASLALNSEYFQQSGVALFQARQDKQAKAMFERARKTIPDDQVRNGEMTLKMSSNRFLNLISTPFPKLDDEFVLLDEARQVYGADSLEAAMCVHWAAACALLTDSPTAHIRALV